MSSTLRRYVAPEFARKLKNVPTHKLPLGLLPTPIHKWDLPGVPEGFEVWIKRDDLSGLTLSGNKVRKLEFIVADALQQNPPVDTLITIGGSHSNHCRATAVAANIAGLKSDLILRLNPGQTDPGLEGNMMINRLMGARVHTVSRQDYRKYGQYTLVDTLAEQLRAKGENPYKVPVGGSTAIGVFGYLDFITEVDEQCADLSVAPFRDLVFACGSGGTAAGLALGLYLRDQGNQDPQGANASSSSRAHAVCACDDAVYFTQHVQEMMDALGMDDIQAKDLPSLDVVEGYVGKGYAQTTPEEISLIRDIAQRTGVILDPVYSGKAVHGLLTELRERPERFPSKRILFVHTGGMFGVYDHANMFRESFEANGVSTVNALAIE